MIYVGGGDLGLTKNNFTPPGCQDLVNVAILRYRPKCSSSFSPCSLRQRTWRQDRDRIEKLVDAGKKLISALGFVRDLVKDLVGHDGSHGAADFAVTLQVGPVVRLKEKHWHHFSICF